MTTAVILVSAVLVAAVIAWFVTARKHPENAAGHPEPRRTRADQFYGDVNDRPGSPGAEADGVAGRGEPVPGPSAEASSPAGSGPRRTGHD